MNHILEEIKQERQRQDAKWGEQNHEHLKWNVILGEEIGEVQKELCELTFAKDDAAKSERLKNLRTELVQSAAVIVNWLECIHRSSIELVADEGWGIFNHYDVPEIIENLKIEGNKILVLRNTMSHPSFFNWVIDSLERKQILKSYNRSRAIITTIFGSKLILGTSENAHIFKEDKFGCVIYFCEVDSETKSMLNSQTHLNDIYLTAWKNAANHKP